MKWGWFIVYIIALLAISFVACTHIEVFELWEFLALWLGPGLCYVAGAYFHKGA